MIDGNTEIIAHIGYPTFSFKSPEIYNPYFEQAGINAVVVPMGCQAADYPAFLKAVFRLTNIRGALITMPHKVVTVDLLDEVSPMVRVAGACNAVKRLPDGRLVGDMFDGAGFVRSVQRQGVTVAGLSALVVGCGGVGAAIAASLAAAGLARMGLYDINAASQQALAARLKDNYLGIQVDTGSKDPQGYELVVNATPLGMKANDPLPMDVSRLSPKTFVGEVVLAAEVTPFLAAARARGCRTQVGSDMLYEQIPAYLEFFNLQSTSAEHLRSLAMARPSALA